MSKEETETIEETMEMEDAVRKAAKCSLVELILERCDQSQFFPEDLGQWREPSEDFWNAIGGNGNGGNGNGGNWNGDGDQAFVEILHRLEEKFKERILGQDELIRAVLMSLVMNEHALLEGLPGVGKTEIIKWIAVVCGLPFSRVQFIPDMLPSDLIGKEQIDIERLHRNESGAIQWANGPVFGSIVLADEINRAPSKVQAALLEAMGERQVTPFGKMSRAVLSPLHEAALAVWGEKFPGRGLLGLPCIPASRQRRDLQDFSQFTVFATMNPIEQEGTYPLSEAQLDRFCFKVIVPYPDRDYYVGISNAVYRGESIKPIEVNLPARKCEAYFRRYPARMVPILLPLYFFLRCRMRLLPLKFGAPHWRGLALRSAYDDLFQNGQGREPGGMLQAIYDVVYMTSARTAPVGEGGTAAGRYDLVQLRMRDFLSREEHKSLAAILERPHCQYVKAGASPRGFLKLVPAALCHALIDGRTTLEKRDIRAVACNVLRHRIHMDVHARLAGVAPEDVVHGVCEEVLKRVKL